MPAHSAPTIGIDCRFAATSSGIGRYVRELVRELIVRDDPWNYVLFLPANKSHGLENTESSRIIHFPLTSFHYSLKEQWEVPRAIRASSINLLHAPHFNVPLRCPVPFITTIHDLILHDFPNEAGFLKRMAYGKLMKHAITHALHIVAVSRATEDDILLHYGNPHNKAITVIHHGLDPRFAPQPENIIRAARQQYHLPDRFILYVGAAKKHKNVETLMDACPADLPLFLISGGKETTQLPHRPNVTILQPDDDDLPALYAASSVYVQPSYKEGFGMPVLEAMACGTRVVVSAISSLSEIAGEHAILVEPTEEGLRAGILQAITEKWNPEPARIHAQSFTWKKAAEETAKVYAANLKF